MKISHIHAPATIIGTLVSLIWFASYLTLPVTALSGHLPAPHVNPKEPGFTSRTGASVIATAQFSATVWLPVITKEGCAPSLAITSTPDYGNVAGVLGGRAGCVAPADHAVAVYIFVEGWWTKPTFAAPLTPLATDGSWSADVVTGGADQFATQFAAFLVPATFAPPLLGGEQRLPQILFDNAAAYQLVARPAPARTLTFAGHMWRVKASATPVGPGPNYFSDRPEDVWVDDQGRLHLRIVYRDGHWDCSEVVTTEALGYGTYTFALAGRPDQLDKNAVLGLFTWDDAAPAHNYREIDIEFSRWGVEAGDNVQYVVQPWDRPGNLHRFPLTLDDEGSSHHFTWRAATVDFASFRSLTLPPVPGSELAAWSYTGADIPPAGAGNARINLWLVDGAPPSAGQEIEVVVAAFDFAPAP